MEGRVEGGVAGANPPDEVVGLNFTAGAGIVVIGEAVRLLVGLAAITAGSRGLGADVENVGLAAALPLAAGAASTMRIGSSAAAEGCVEKEEVEVEVEGVELIGEVAAGVARISLRIVPPEVAGLLVASGSVTIGGNVLAVVAESVGVAGGG
jgi:hypothetical protein